MLDLAYVAPATNISIVFALPRPDKVAMKIIVATAITAIRAVEFCSALQIATGANRRAIMRDATRVWAARFDLEPENMCTFGSLEIS